MWIGELGNSNTDHLVDLSLQSFENIYRYRHRHRHIDKDIGIDIDIDIDTDIDIDIYTGRYRN